MIKKLLLFAYKSKNADNVLIALGAVGLLVSMFAQLTAVKTNNNISEDKKKFLLNQEKADGITNTGLYLGVTTLCSKLIKSAFDKGQILTKELKDDIEKTLKDHNDIKTNRAIKIDELIKDVLGAEDLKTININNVPKSFKKIGPMKEGLAMLATIAGSVLSCNIITPLVRNKISNNMQKKYDLEKIQAIPYPKQPLTPNVYTRQNTFASFSSITKI